MSTRISAWRNLRMLRGWRPVPEALDASLVGVLQSGDVTLILTNTHVFWGHGHWVGPGDQPLSDFESIAYRDLAEIHCPPKDDPAGVIHLVLRDGRTLQRSVPGTDGKFRDVYSFASFLTSCQKEAMQWTASADDIFWLRSYRDYRKGFLLGGGYGLAFQLFGYFQQPPNADTLTAIGVQIVVMLLVILLVLRRESP